MSPAQLEAGLHAYCGRRPFRAFLIEFTSGVQVTVKHPEVVRKSGSSYVLRAPDHGFSFFSAESVCRLLDLPNAQS